ncbi:MBL fold metallo-hydrolase [Apilactobacillus xinyiensis]|uniref:MBL fold metallo-hydrolase n=1 Tax=Apilactobacillus xinyiensis TaxID=2841032 RepID=UPI00200FEA26|nr:MBL fold metallo-hydrolase [Apilactobacillus xinyiensis]MCL0329874.1 MBL fold metallo-hydrolase [Apilactobacillus xinyiensis]
MHLKVLGYYGGYPYNNIGTSAYLLSSDEYNLMIDCGSGDLLSLENNLNPLMLDDVIISHYHNDHMADVGVLQYYWQLHKERPNKDILPIYGNNSNLDIVSSFNWPNSTVGKSFDASTKLELGPFIITFKKVHHPVPSFAIRIVEKSTNKILVYTSDTYYFKELDKFSENADLLITDTNFYSDKDGKKWHMTSTESGKLAKNANVKKLLLSHLPQNGDLNQLLEEARIASSNQIDISLAQQNLDIKI